MLPKPHSLFSEETFEFWDFFSHDMQNDRYKQKKVCTRKIVNDTIFPIKFVSLKRITLSIF